MLNWLKFISKSIISNKEAKTAANRSMWNAVFFFIVSFILLSFFYSNGYNLSFGSHYNNSPAFHEALKEVIMNDNFNCSISVSKTDDSVNVLSCSNNKLSGDYNLPENQKLYMEDEFTTTEKSKEVVYKLFLDTREQTSYIAYESTYVNKENNEISRDEYLALPSTSRSNYTLKDLKLTNELIDINSMLTTITDYFSKVEDESILETYNKINELEDIDKKNNELYNLYIACIEKEVIDNQGYAPTLLRYYQEIYSKLDENGNQSANPRIIILLRNEAYFNFVDEKGINVVFYGVYTKLNGFTFQYDALDSESKINDHIDSFVNTLYGDFKLIVTYAFFSSILQYVPILLMIVIFLSLIIYIFAKLSNDDYTNNKFFGAFKIVFATMVSGALISGLTALIVPFYFSIENMFKICISIFLIVIIIRCLYIAISSYFIARKKLKLAMGSKEQLEQEEMELM